MVFDEKNTPELHNRRITSLFEATDGTLWIGTENGDVSQYKDGHFSSVPLRANRGDGKIYAITADDVGDVWLMNGAGELARARDGKVLSPPSGTVTNVVSLTRGRDGTVWVNAVKHSRASEVLIRLEVKEKWFELTVKDNGQGFAFGEKMKNSPVIHGRTAAGNGLENMERRPAAIGGNCEIQSTPGTGPGGCFSCNSRLPHSGNRGDTGGIQGLQARGSAASMISTT